jgi:hypothetical protein
MADCVEKVLFGRRPKFFWTADAFHARRREGPHQFTQTQPRTVLLVLKSRAAAERPNNRPSRDFRSRSIFDFFNSIGAKRPLAKAAKSAEVPEWTLCVPPCVPDRALAGIDRRAGCRSARTTVPAPEEAFALGGTGRKPSGLVSCPTQTHPLSSGGK